MSELASYSIQALFLALLALVFFSRESKIDGALAGLVVFWTIGVIYIYANFGNDQILFYSNDQAFHQSIVSFYLPIEGIKIESIISLRYVITIPVYVLAKFGFNIALLFKFFQLFCALSIIRRSKIVLQQFEIPVKGWMYVFFSGPLLSFMSLLALRDVILACCTLFFIFPSNSKHRCLSVVLIGLLRPHLAAALIFGLCVEKLFQRIKPRLEIFAHALVLFFSYLVGSFCFPLGDFVLNGSNLRIPETIFSIKNISQIGLNLIGLQFLLLDGENGSVVAATTLFLLLARLIFIETFLVPTMFYTFCAKPIRCVRRETILISASMFFFYGLIFQNNSATNSTRQNLPFITVMGLICVIRLYQNQITTRMISPNPETFSKT